MNENRIEHYYRTRGEQKPSFPMDAQQWSVDIGKAYDAGVQDATRRMKREVYQAYRDGARQAWFDKSKEWFFVGLLTGMVVAVVLVNW